MNTDPRLAFGGGGGTVGGPRHLESLKAYRLEEDSPALTAGVDLLALGVDIGRRDFFRVALPPAESYTAAGASAMVMARIRERA